MGLTGLGYCGFVLSHMAGNLLLLISAEAYNKYSHAIVSNKPLLYGAETALVVMLLLHVICAISVTLENRAARPVSYALNASGDKATSLAARTMALTGLFILAFLILHIVTFKYGEYYSATYDGVEMRDLHRLVSEKFQSPLYTGWYLFCLALLGLHISHGFSAAFQSLGIVGARHPKLRMTALGFAALIACGFIVQPLFFFFGAHL